MRIGEKDKQKFDDWDINLKENKCVEIKEIDVQKNKIFPKE